MALSAIIIGIGLFFYLLTCLAFLDITNKNFGSKGLKVLWGCIAFIPFIGVIIYFIFGFRKGKQSAPE